MKKKITSVTLAAVMSVSMAAGVPVSADLFTAQETQKTSLAEVDGKKEYDEADWEAYKKEYWEKTYDDEWDSTQKDLKILDSGLMYVIFSGQAQVVDYIGKGEELVIPKTIENLPVTGLFNHETFDNCGWEIFGFNNLKNVKTVRFEASFTRLGKAFVGCPELEKVILPEGLERMQTDCGEEYLYCEAFSDCPKLKEVVIPDSLDFVEGGCFRNTPWLKAREKKEKLVVIGHTLLSGRKAEGKVVVPNGIKWIADEAFFNNKKMTELVIPASVEKNDNYYTYSVRVFDNCTGLKKITFKQGSNGIWSFISVKDAPNLKKIIIPPSFDVDAVNALLGVFGWEELNENSNLNITYYYYKGTAADKVLNIQSEPYTKFKKSLLPGKTKSFKAAAKRKAIKTSWKTVSTATGYQIQVSPDNNFKNNVTRKFINNNKKTTYTFKNLRSGVKYYVRLRTYKTFDGKKYYGKYTKVRSIITKY